MTNSVAVSRNLPAIPERAFLPRLSKVMTDALWLVTAGRAVTDGARAEARDLLTSLDPLFAKPRPPQVRNWLARINLGTSRPLTPTDFEIRCAVLVDALLEYPAAVFTADTARAAMFTFQWFPGGHDLAAFFVPHVRRIKEFERELKLVADCTIVDAPPRPEPTEAEREAVSALVRSVTGKAPPNTFHEPERTVEEQIAAIRSAA